MVSLVSAVAKSSVTHVLFAFLVMGAWAFFANSNHVMPKPLIAGLVQGVISASITLVMKKALESLSSRLPGLSALYLPPLIVCTSSLAVLITLHTLARTPELTKTIALPFSVAATYAVVYTLSLYYEKKNYG